ncbi:hypothetical protein HXX76_008461 [Chlamydomonas incerta]|uniref:F-box domain-containing protein n=1 Tax=Chlamydomonas incerta TaxID=51695 RepID=A0A835SUP0_CHLIN|nr:hypothetical protein HXX76_008461 [Chlamydomonas incerta]|eukprot:KAG2433403.1 hypothetical protein HXX76_008461 [Chlamydomonas incerta]
MAGAAVPAPPDAACELLARLPPDLILSHVAPQLPPGQRLGLRCVCRAWAAAIEATAPHVNLVMEADWMRRHEARAAAAAAAAAEAASAAAAAAGRGAGAAAAAPQPPPGAAAGPQEAGAQVDQAATPAREGEQDGVGRRRVVPPAILDLVMSGLRNPGSGAGLVRRFEGARALRLWLGAAPWGADHLLPPSWAEQATAGDAQPGGSSSGSSKANSSGSSTPGILAMAAAAARQVAVDARATAAAFARAPLAPQHRPLVGGAVALAAAAAAAASAAASAAALRLLLCAVVLLCALAFNNELLRLARARAAAARAQRQAPGVGESWRAAVAAAERDVRWRAAHSAAEEGADRGRSVLRNIAHERPDPTAWPSLPACLAWIAPPQHGGGAATATGGGGGGGGGSGSANGGSPVAAPRQPGGGCGGGGGGAAATGLRRLTHLSALVASRTSDLEPQVLQQLAAACPHLHGLSLHCRQSLAGRHAPLAFAPLPSLAPLAPLGASLRTLVLSGVWAGAAPSDSGLGPEVLRPTSRRAAGLPPRLGLEALVGLRALVLHRVRGRMHWLLPQLQVLTGLTRLELLELDYIGGAAAASEYDKAAAEARAAAEAAEAEAQRDAWRRARLAAHGEWSRRVAEQKARREARAARRDARVAAAAAAAVAAAATGAVAPASAAAAPADEAAGAGADTEMVDDGGWVLMPAGGGDGGGGGGGAAGAGPAPSGSSHAGAAAAASTNVDFANVDSGGGAAAATDVDACCSATSTDVEGWDSDCDPRLEGLWEVMMGHQELELGRQEQEQEQEQGADGTHPAAGGPGGPPVGAGAGAAAGPRAPPLPLDPDDGGYAEPFFGLHQFRGYERPWPRWREVMAALAELVAAVSGGGSGGAGGVGGGGGGGATAGAGAGAGAAAGGGQRVLALDVECPSDPERGQPAWELLLRSVRRHCGGLVELRLPHLALASRPQAAALAAALPGLRHLEIGSLPAASLSRLKAARRRRRQRRDAVAARRREQVQARRAGQQQQQEEEQEALAPAGVAAAGAAAAGAAAAAAPGAAAGPCGGAAAAVPPPPPPPPPLLRCLEDLERHYLWGGRPQWEQAQQQQTRPAAPTSPPTMPTSTTQQQQQEQEQQVPPQGVWVAGKGRHIGSPGPGAGAGAGGIGTDRGAVGGGVAASAGGGEGGRLACFASLQSLTVRSSAVEELVAYGLPLPPRPAGSAAAGSAGSAAGSGRSWMAGEVRLQLRNRAEGQAGDHLTLAVTDLLHLHSALLPALHALPPAAPLAPAPPPNPAAGADGDTTAATTTTTTTSTATGTGAGLALRVGPARGASGPLLCAMLGAWVPHCLVELDVTSLTHPGAATGHELLGTLAHIRASLPRLRRLAACLWAARPSFFRPDASDASGADGAGAAAAVAAALLLPCGAASNSSSSSSSKAAAEARVSALMRAVRAAGGGRDAVTREAAGGVPWALVECVAGLAELQELRLTVVAVADWARPPVSPGVGVSRAYQPQRVPLGLLAALAAPAGGQRRAGGPLKVVDCSPLDCWCSAHELGKDADPRVLLANTRAALAAACRALRSGSSSSGGGCTLVLAVEEDLAAAEGRGPAAEARWREEVLACRRQP